MNKKFSTLVGCLALGTAFSAVGQVNFPVSDAYTQVTPCATGLTYRSFGTKSASTLGSEVNKIEANKWYQLRVDGEEGEKVLIQERNFKTGEVTLRIVDAKDAPLNYSLWQISYNKSDGQTGGKFTFKNKETGLGIVFDHETAYTIDEFGTNVVELGAGEKISILEGCNTEWSWFSSNKDNNNTLANKVLYAQFHDSDKYLVLKKSMNATANPDGLNIPGKQVVSVVYSSDDAGDGAVSCNALRFTPVETVPILLGAKDINRMIDAQKDGAASFKILNVDGDLQTNGTLGVASYIVEESDLADQFIALANGQWTEEKKAKAEKLFEYVDSHYAVWADKDENGQGAAYWGEASLSARNDEEKESYNKVVTAYTQYVALDENDPIELAKKVLVAYEVADAILNDYNTYAKTIAETDKQIYLDDVEDTRWNAANNLIELIAEPIVSELQGVLQSAEYRRNEAALAKMYSLKFAEVDKDGEKTGKYLMVDTAFWASNTTKVLQLANKKPAGTNPYLLARNDFRVTYYPTVDSLVIEPLNASVKDNEQVNVKWKDSYVAQKFIWTADVKLDRAESYNC